MVESVHDVDATAAEDRRAVGSGERAGLSTLFAKAQQEFSVSKLLLDSPTE